MPSLFLIKRLTDAALFVSLTAVFLYPWTGETGHYAWGFAWLTVLLLHNGLNYAWYRALPKGNYSPRRFLTSALVFVLWAAVLGVFVSGVKLAWGNGGLAARQLHVSCAYWLLLLSGVNVGLHGALFTSRLKRCAAAFVWACRVISWTGCLFGIYAFIRMNVWEKLIFRRSFGGALDGCFVTAVALSALFWLAAAAAYYLMKTGEKK